MSLPIVPAKRQGTETRDRPAYPRKRAAQACRTCRQRRTKCDNEQPSCTSCREIGVECSYVAADKSTFDAASLAILKRLDELEDVVRSSDRAPTSSQAVHRFSDSAAFERRDLESPALERTEASVLYHINIETVLSWPVFNNRGFNQHVDLNYLLSSSRQSPAPSRLLLTSDVESEDAATLLRAFLDTIHIYNPILEVPKVNDYMKEVHLNGWGWDAQSCLLLLIYALGSITVPFGAATAQSGPESHSARFQRAESFFIAAQKRIWTLLYTSSVIDAQCFFLAGVYLMTTLRPIEAWRMFVQALACCHCFPAPSLSNGSPDDESMQLQNSVYWTCLRSELELRLELGVGKKRELDLTYPAFFPSPPKSLVPHGEPTWYFYLSEIALRRLGNRILNFVYHHDPYRTSTADIINAVENFERQADTWLKSLPPILKLDSSDGVAESTDAEHAALRFILKGHLLDCYEMMYWPFVVDAIRGSGRPGEQSSNFLRKGLDLCVRRIDDNEEGFFYRHHGTWLMLRSCTRSALVLLSAQKSGLGILLDTNWESAVSRVMQMLKFWESELPDVAHYLKLLGKLVGEETYTSPTSTV